MYYEHKSPNAQCQSCDHLPAKNSLLVAQVSLSISLAALAVSDRICAGKTEIMSMCIGILTKEYKVTWNKG